MNKNRMFNPMEVGLFNVSDFFATATASAEASNHDPLTKKQNLNLVPCHSPHTNGLPSHVRITKVAKRIFSSVTDSELERVEISRTGCVTFVTKSNQNKIRYIAGRVSTTELAEHEILCRS